MSQDAAELGPLLPRAEISQHHSLAIDPDESGGWGRIDRWSRRFSEWLNPITVKEARQSLKSRQFVITFFLLLTASCLWTIMGVALNAPNVYHLPTGDQLLAGYYFVLAIPMMGMVPLAAFRSLAAEIDEGTFEMLMVTQLSSTRIVLGKLNSAMLQMLIYFAAIVPCLAFSYLLRGVELPTIAALIVVVFFTALLITSIALLLAAIAVNRAMQTLALLAVLGVIVFAEFTCGIVCMEGILFESGGSDIEVIMAITMYLILGGSCLMLFIKAAAAKIAPITENRTTVLRYIMIVQSLLWVGSMALLLIWYGDLDQLNFGNMVVGGYWLLMGTLMLAESPELSPRVLRGLPQTTAGRAMLSWLNPGPGTGFVFAIATGCVSIICLMLFGIIEGGDRSPRTNPLTFAMVIIGYLCGYLGLVRLIAIPLCRRFQPMLVVPVSTLIAVMGLALILPTVLSVLATGETPRSYLPLEAINWGWTLLELFERSYSHALAVSIMTVGGLIAAINLLLVLREMDYRKVAVPQRVVEDMQAKPRS